MQATIPAKILHIKSLIAAESDPESVLFIGHTTTAAFVPNKFQPADALASLHLIEGQKITFPTEVDSVKAGSTTGPNPKDLTIGAEIAETDTSVDAAMHGENISDPMPTKGVEAGPHWFEVVPLNKVQHEFVQLSIK